MRRFSRLVVLTEFWTTDFQGRFSQVGSHKLWLYIYTLLFLVFFCFVSCNQRFLLRHETQFSSKFGPKLSLPYPFFSSTLSTNHCCCYVYCNYKCSRAWCI
jgi:hypothetical protein